MELNIGSKVAFQALPDSFDAVNNIRDYLERNFYHAYFGYVTNTKRTPHPEDLIEVIGLRISFMDPHFVILPFDGKWYVYQITSNRTYVQKFYRDVDVSQIFAYCQGNKTDLLIWLFSDNEVEEGK